MIYNSGGFRPTGELKSSGGEMKEEERQKGRMEGKNSSGCCDVCSDELMYMTE